MKKDNKGVFVAEKINNSWVFCRERKREIEIKFWRGV